MLLFRVSCKYKISDFLNVAFTESSSPVNPIIKVTLRYCICVSAYFKNNDGMCIIIYTKDIADFYIIEIGVLTCFKISEGGVA